MRYSVAIYRAGIVVDVNHCDYDSDRELGLTCPFCREAVFLRAGNTHQRRPAGSEEAKTVDVPPVFCHYPGVEGRECELRAARPDGQNYIERLTIECRNQRLALYNKHLWEMMQQSWGLKRSILVDIERNIGDKLIDFGLDHTISQFEAIRLADNLRGRGCSCQVIKLDKSSVKPEPGPTDAVKGGG